MNGIVIELSGQGELMATHSNVRTLKWKAVADNYFRASFAVRCYGGLYSY